MVVCLGLAGCRDVVSLDLAKFLLNDIICETAEECADLVSSAHSGVPDIQEVMNAYNEFLNGERSIEYANETLFVSDVMTDLIGYKVGKKYTFFDVNRDGVPDLVMQSHRFIILSYNDDNLFVLFSDFDYAGSYRLVNDGKLFYTSFGRANHFWRTIQELDRDGNLIFHYRVDLYAVGYNEDTDTWTNRAVLYEGDAIPYTDEGYNKSGIEITEEEFYEYVTMMQKDDEVEWVEFNLHD